MVISPKQSSNKSIRYMDTFSKSVTNSIPHGLCKLFDGCICLLSLGFFYSSLEMNYVTWHAKRKFRKMTVSPKQSSNKKT